LVNKSFAQFTLGLKMISWLMRLKDIMKN